MIRFFYRGNYSYVLRILDGITKGVRTERRRDRCGRGTEEWGRGGVPSSGRLLGIPRRKSGLVTKTLNSSLVTDEFPNKFVYKKKGVCIYIYIKTGGVGKSKIKYRPYPGFLNAYIIQGSTTTTTTRSLV